jgi:hypothetical protein
VFAQRDRVAQRAVGPPYVAGEAQYLTPFHIAAHPVEQKLGRRIRNGSTDRPRLFITGQGARCVAEIGIVEIALYVAQPVVTARNLFQKIAIPPGFLDQRVVVL